MVQLKNTSTFVQSFSVVGGYNHLNELNNSFVIFSFANKISPFVTAKLLVTATLLVAIYNNTRLMHSSITSLTSSTSSAAIHEMYYTQLLTMF